MRPSNTPRLPMSPGQSSPERQDDQRLRWSSRLVEPPAGIEPATPSLPWNHQEPLCEPPFPQVAPDRRGRSYRFSSDEVMRSLCSRLALMVATSRSSSDRIRLRTGGAAIAAARGADSYQRCIWLNGSLGRIESRCGLRKACLLPRRGTFAGRWNVAFLKLIQGDTSPCCGDLVALPLEKFKPLLRSHDRLTAMP